MNSRIASCKLLLTKRRQVLVSLLDTIPCAQPCLVRAPRFYSTVSGKGGEHGRGRERKKERAGNNNKGGGSSGRVKTLKCATAVPEAWHFITEVMQGVANKSIRYNQGSLNRGSDFGFKRPMLSVPDGGFVKKVASPSAANHSKRSARVSSLKEN